MRPTYTELLAAFDTGQYSLATSQHATMPDENGEPINCFQRNVTGYRVAVDRWAFVTIMANDYVRFMGAAEAEASVLSKCRAELVRLTETAS